MCLRFYRGLCTSVCFISFTGNNAYTQVQSSNVHTHTHRYSHKEKEVVQAVSKTQGDPLIGCIIMIKYRNKEKGKLIQQAVSGRVKLKERFNLVLYGYHPTLINA